MIGIYRAQRKNHLREDHVPMDRRHAGGLKGGFVSVNILRTKIGRLRGMRVVSQIREKPMIRRDVLLDGAPRSQRAAEFGLSANSAGKGYSKCSRAQVREIDFDDPTIARLNVEAQTEYLVTGMSWDTTICGRKTNWSSLPRPPPHNECSDGSSASNSSTAASTASAREAI
ncbi:hypothetical protein RAD15_09070 [Bradyrhizobium sp. 14AA]